MLGLGEGRGDKGRDDPAAALAGMGERIALEMNPAALSGGRQHPRRGRLNALMRIADHQLHTAEAAAHEVAQKLCPEG